LTIAQDFTASVSAAEADLPGAELLPERLAQACAAVLPVDGAGLSVFFSADRRLPLGASDDAAATAERLQFTVGQGPCLTAHDTGRLVVADDAELGQRWPAFTDLLVAQTPIRGVIALPLDGPLQGIGALDLYLRSPDAVRTVSLADVTVVLGSLTRAFGAAMAEEPHTESGPAWLDAPAAGRRAQVWQALGMVNVGLGLRTQDAMALLRAHAYGNDTSVDDIADAVVHRRLTLEELSLSTGTAS
jgi:hypothetical protein